MTRALAACALVLAVACDRTEKQAPPAASTAAAAAAASTPAPVASTSPSAAPAAVYSAMKVCEQLVAAGVASNCKTKEPGGLGSAASESVDFDLVSVPGERGQVLSFDRDGFYDACVKAYENYSTLAGRHQYGSRKARVFVQMNTKASNETGAKAKAVVDAL